MSSVYTKDGDAALTMQMEKSEKNMLTMLTIYDMRAWELGSGIWR